MHWSKPADLTGPPLKKGYGWIARGLWKRDGVGMRTDFEMAWSASL